MARYGPLLVLLAALGVGGALYLASGDGGDGAADEAVPPLQARALAELTVSSEPSGASVFIDGNPVGRTPLRQEALPSGVYILSVLPEEGAGVDTFVVLDEAGAQSFFFDLAPPPALADAAPPREQAATREQTGSRSGNGASQNGTSRTGRLVVTSEPRGATVWVDGARVGEAPLVLGDLAAGAHEVVLWMEGHEPFVASAEVEPQGMRAVRATFGPDAAAAPAERSTARVAAPPVV